MQLTYHYSRNKLHLFSMVVLLLLGTILLGMGVAAGVQVGKKPSDNAIFIALGAVFTLLGVFFIWFGIWVYRKMEIFYRSGKWYGITLNGDRLVSSDFALFRAHTITINRSGIDSHEQRQYKGRLYLYIKANNKLYALPIALLSLTDRQLLANWLRRS